MFKYPLTLSRNTLYAKLGLGPDATPADISDARANIVGRLNARIRLLQMRLVKVQEAVPELQAAKEKIQEISKKESRGSGSALQAAHSHLKELEKRAVKAEPGYFTIVHEVEQIEADINEMNSIRLENPEARREYDLATPPCALLKIEAVESPVLRDRRVMLWNVRCRLSAFFEEEMGLYCYHPSDQTRRFFLEDFEPNDLLDKEDG